MLLFYQCMLYTAAALPEYNPWGRPAAGVNPTSGANPAPSVQAPDDAIAAGAIDKASQSPRNQQVLQY